MLYEDNYLSHFGIKGQKWGVRRFQNEDGSLTEAGKKRYLEESLDKLAKDIRKQEKKVSGSSDNETHQRKLEDMKTISEYRNARKELHNLTKGDDWDGYIPGDSENEINYPGVTDDMFKQAEQLRKKKNELYDKISKMGTKVKDL